MKTICALLSLLAACSAWAAGDTRNAIESLAWMSGDWSGSAGDGTLEETWNPPRAGTMAAVVRMSSAQQTQFIELIVISAEADGLVLRIQQFNQRFEPLFEPAQRLRATSQSENTVTFEADSPGGLRQLVYTRPSVEEFNIDVTLTEGTKFEARLRAR